MAREHVTDEQDGGDNAAHFDDEHYGIAHHLARTKLRERVDDGAANDAGIPDRNGLGLVTQGRRVQLDLSGAVRWLSFWFLHCRWLHLVRLLHTLLKMSFLHSSAGAQESDRDSAP